jgi:hypothetical protein
MERFTIFSSHVRFVAAALSASFSRTYSEATTTCFSSKHDAEVEVDVEARAEAPGPGPTHKWRSLWLVPGMLSGAPMHC